MRNIILLRHAQAAQGLGVRDHDRPLTPVGLAQAHAIAVTIEQAVGAIDIAVASDARRTRQTLAEVTKYLSIDDQWHDSGLYTADPDDILHLARSFNDDIETVLIVGHEPTMSGTAYLLGGYDGYVKVATGVLLQSEGRWCDIAPRGCDATYLGRAEIPEPAAGSAVTSSQTWTHTVKRWLAGR